MATNIPTSPYSEYGTDGPLSKPQSNKEIRQYILDWLEQENLDLARAAFILHMHENALLTILNGGGISPSHHVSLKTFIPGIK